jgi:[acyl-carrier-protein] S-malonyltransferase
VLGLFPGQGSQKVGMGKELFESTEIGKKLFAMADECLGFPLSTICFEGPAERLTATEVAQPAILTVSTICYELAREKNPSLALCAAAGHSLGEYSALVAAGALSFADAVVLVHKRGSYMQKAVPAGVGKMVAVLGKEVPEIEAALAKVTKGVAQIANVNAPGQIVIAGAKEAVEEFVTLMPGTKVMELQVSAPFHCSLMKPAEEALAKDLATAGITMPRFPVYANYTAAAVRDGEEIRKTLQLQVCGRVRWVESMNAAIRETNPTMAVEFGAGNVLTGLLKRIAPELTRKNISGPENATL